MQDAVNHADAYDRAFAALAHPTRRQILITIHFGGGSMGAGEIARMFEHAWPTTSRHLQVMEEAGLLTHERHGRARTYHINRERLELLTDWLDLMRATGPQQAAPPEGPS